MSELRPIPGLSGYLVDADGQVWSMRQGRLRRMRTKRERSRSGYLGLLVAVAPCRYKHFRVHRLVLEAFHGPRPAGGEARHLDGDPTNNRADNLAWGTRKENGEDRVRHGTSHTGPARLARLSPDSVREIRRLRAEQRLPHATLAKMFRITPGTVASVLNRRSWRWVS
jgi:hypothetical protein